MLARLTRTDRRWMIIWLLAVAIALVVYHAPWAPTMVDLEVYRVGARALLSGTDLYTVMEPENNLPFTYPVFAAALFIPFALLPTLGARILLLVLSFAALLVIMQLTVRSVRRATGRTAGSALAWSVPLSIVAVVLHPVWETLNFGQVNLILTALVLVDVLTGRTGRARGALVGLAAGIKLVPGIFILYFLVTGQRRAALASAVTTLVTVVVGFVLQPGPAWEFWTHHALTPARTGGVSYVMNQSLLGTTSRLLRDPDPPRVISLGVAVVVVVVALWIARVLYRRGELLMAVSVVGVASLLASPISWSHHWVWAIPVLGTLVIWASTSTSPGRWRWWVFGVATAIVAAGPMQFTPKRDLRELQHTVPLQVVANIYALLGVAYLVWAAVRSIRTPVTKSPTSPSPA